jgi:hypothetical protein
MESCGSKNPGPPRPALPRSGSRMPIHTTSWDELLPSPPGRKANRSFCRSKDGQLCMPECRTVRERQAGAGKARQEQGLDKQDQMVILTPPLIREQPPNTRRSP